MKLYAAKIRGIVDLVNANTWFSYSNMFLDFIHDSMTPCLHNGTKMALDALVRRRVSAGRTLARAAPLHAFGWFHGGRDTEVLVYDRFQRLNEEVCASRVGSVGVLQIVSSLVVMLSYGVIKGRVERTSTIGESRDGRDAYAPRAKGRWGRGSFRLAQPCGTAREGYIRALTPTPASISEIAYQDYNP